MNAQPMDPPVHEPALRRPGTAAARGGKVLVVSDVPPFPTSSGNRARIRTLTEVIAGLGHELHFAALVRPGSGLDPQMSRHYGRRLHVLPFERRRGPAWAWEHAARRLRQRLNLDAGWLWTLDAWYDDRLDARLRELQARESFDTVLIEYVYLSRAACVFPPGVRTVIDTHDRFTRRHRAAREAGQAYGWFSLAEADERRGLARADAVIAIQDDEAAFFSALLAGTSTTVETVGHVFEPAAPVRRARARRALLVGSHNPVNAEGARYFVGQVLPRVQQELPDFELLIAGDVGQAVADAPGLRKLGRVTAIGEAYAQAALALNPVRSGTGLCIKSLETLAYGLPLVTTRSGARGLEAWAGSAFSMVPDDDPQAMAAAICTLLRRDDQAEAMGRSARAAALEINRVQLAALRRLLGRGEA
ncbi:glycosyltransferase family 4 protein [Rubrivivax gelatinosus]|nr:glycosyltransferase family 4 protein [Rubrivivax gelatinosus]